MREHGKEFGRRGFLGGAAVLGAVAVMEPTVAFAASAAEKQAEAESVRNQLIGMQADYEVAINSFHKANEEQEAAQAAMDSEQAKIDEASVRITSCQEKLGTRARGMYRSGSANFVDFVLGATSFDEFSQNWGLLDKMNVSDSKMVEETKTLREVVQASRDEFARQEYIAAEKANEAQSIKVQAEAQVARATELVSSLDSEARVLLEQEQAAAAAAAAAVLEQEQRRSDVQDFQGSNGRDSDEGSKGDGGYTSSGSGPVGDYDSVVGYALSRIGCPYVWAAAGPNAFDCSGLVVWAYEQVGRGGLPHYDQTLYAVAKARVPVSQARPGDVLWRPGHVGIAVGYGGQPYVHAPTFGAYVRDTDSLSWAGFTCALQF